MLTATHILSLLRARRLLSTHYHTFSLISILILSLVRLSISHDLFTSGFRNKTFLTGNCMKPNCLTTDVYWTSRISESNIFITCTDTAVNVSGNLTVSYSVGTNNPFPTIKSPVSESGHWSASNGELKIKWS